MRERTGHAILERYGMTETGMNTSNPYDGERIAGTVGCHCRASPCASPTPSTGALLGRGEIGMIEVRGPNVFAGYWRMPEKTKAEFREDGFFITGDLGVIDARGYVHIVGRGKDLIISGGLNVYPKEVESAIDALPGVVESAVIGVPHPDFGEGVTAAVVTEPGLTEADVRRAAQEAARRAISCRSASSSCTNCRATPWGRCRKTCFATPIAISSPDVSRRSLLSQSPHTPLWCVSTMYAVRFESPIQDTENQPRNRSKQESHNSKDKPSSKSKHGPFDNWGAGMMIVAGQKSAEYSHPDDKDNANPAPNSCFQAHRRPSPRACRRSTAACQLYSAAFRREL